MKIKGLLLGMLAYAAMVACTNEDIVKNNVNQPEKVKGNLSLVIVLHQTHHAQLIMRKRCNGSRYRR